MWKSVKELLLVIKKEKYVFLRNGNDISDDFSENDDWDILCENLDEFVKLCNAVPVGDSRYNYYTWVNNKKLFLDIRTFGDGYYDEEWERTAVEKRTLREEHYILDMENNMYCTLYHALLQKSDEGLFKYKTFIEINFDVFDRVVNINQLAMFMHENNYIYVDPDDQGVYKNISNINTLLEVLKNG